MSNLTLTLIKGNEYKIRVESFEEFNRSLFKNIYNCAARNVKDIVKNTEKYYDNKDDFTKDKEEYNNIIAFIGERGAGKSSAMISFAEALRNLRNERTETCELQEFNNIKKHEFISLDVIDPSLFEGNESIFEVIIAKMFSKFKEYYEEEFNKVEFENKKKLLKSFQDVYRNLKTIDSDRKELYKYEAQSENILETLSMLASGSNMRNSFIKLVQEFLNFFSKTKIESQRFLVIAIDDLDMNIKHAASMAEQIRKYLLVPNIIVLMAIKFEQLSDSIEQEYRINFKVMLERSKISDFPKDMATKYLEKLIPNGRKLYLPQIRAFMEGRQNEVELRFIIDKNNDQNNFLYVNTDNSFPTIQETVLRLTYEKTGLIFIKPEYGIHYLVPDNLRELQNYLTMLSTMSYPKDAPRIYAENLDKFEDYFLNTWVKNNLPLRCIDIIDSFYKINIKFKNKYIIKRINEVINSIGIIVNENEDTLSKNDIINKKVIEDINLYINTLFMKMTNARNISLGDVLSLLKLWNDYDDRDNAKKLSFAIKTIYSILLFRLINIEYVFIHQMEVDNDIKRKEKNKRMDNNYQNISFLIGGDIFGRLAEEFIRRGRGIKQFIGYDSININGNLIGDIIEHIFRNDYTDYRLIMIEWLHYFIYIGRLGEPKPFEESGVYYENEARFTYKGSVGNTTNANFNVTSFIFFLLNPAQNIERVFSRSIDIFLSKKENQKFIQEHNLSKESIIKNIQDNSLMQEINEWKDEYELTYPMVIPLYSLDLLEYVMLNIRDASSKKTKKPLNNKYYSYFKVYIEQFCTILKNISENHPHLQRDLKDGKKVRLNDVFMSCPIVELALNTDKYGFCDDDLVSLFEFIENNPRNSDELKTDKDVLIFYYNNFSFKYMSSVYNMVSRVREIISSLKDKRSAPIIERLTKIIAVDLENGTFDGSRPLRDVNESKIKTILGEGIKMYESEEESNG